MPVGLVPHVPDYSVLGSVKHVVQCHGNLYGTEAGGQMARMLGQHFNYAVPDLAANLRQLLHAELAQVGRRVYLVK